MRKKFLAAIAAAFVLCTCVGAAWAENNRSVPTKSADKASTYYTMTYQMDDVYGNSGHGGQWIAVLRSQDIWSAHTGDDKLYDRWETRGGAMSVLEIDTSGNLINHHPYVWSANGHNIPLWTHHTADAPEMPIRFLFMVMPGNTADFTVDTALRSGADYDEDRSETYILDVNVGDDDYITRKQAMGKVGNVKSYPQANRYKFTLNKEGDWDKYGTKRTYLSFHHNPTETPSQTNNIPLVIANVADANAAEKPLEFNTVVRDYSDNERGQIIATKHFTWDNLLQYNDYDISGGTTEWIFVPQNSMEKDSTIGVGPLSRQTRYKVTIDIKNYSGLRYGLDRYDEMSVGSTSGAIYTQKNIYPDEWRIDLPDDEITGIDRTIKLDKDSHIAPGLISRYTQYFNILSLRQKILSVYPVDTDIDRTSARALWINHTRIAGMPYAAKQHTNAIARSGYTDDESGISYRNTFYRANVDVFAYIPQSENFINRNAVGSTVANDLKLYSASANEAVVDAVALIPNPENTDHQTDVIKAALTATADTDARKAVRQLSEVIDAPTDNAVASIYIDVPQPEYFHYRSSDERQNRVGILPLHLTFNIPVDDYDLAGIWDEMLNTWRQGGSIDDLFYRHFRLYSRALDSAKVPSGVDGVEYRNRDLSKWLTNERAYSDTIKVMLDEDNHMITVNALVMLVNSAKMHYSLLTDEATAYSSNSEEDGVNANAVRRITRKFLTILDGYSDDRWNMGFYIRRITASDSSTPPDGNNGNFGGGSGGGGGCATGACVALGAFALAVLFKRKGR